MCRGLPNWYPHPDPSPTHQPNATSPPGHLLVSPNLVGPERMPGLPQRLQRKPFPRNNSLCPLPGVPAEDYGGILDASPLIPDCHPFEHLLASKSVHNQTLSQHVSTWPSTLHTKGKFSLGPFVSDITFHSSQPHWPPSCPPATYQAPPPTPTLGPRRWLFPPPSGLRSDVTCSVRPSWLGRPCDPRGLNQIMPPKSTSQGLAPGNALSISFDFKAV